MPLPYLVRAAEEAQPVRGVLFIQRRGTLEAAEALANDPRLDRAEKMEEKMSENIKAAETLLRLAELAGVGDQEAFKELAETHAPIFADHYEVFEKIAAFVNDLARQLAAILERVKERVRVIADFLNNILNQYPNKRVLHLAKHGKGRVRKKNINRIRRWVERLHAMPEI